MTDGDVFTLRPGSAGIAAPSRRGEFRGPQRGTSA